MSLFFPRIGRASALLGVIAIALTASLSSVYALSEIRREELPAPNTPSQPGADTQKSLPVPEPVVPHNTEIPAAQPGETEDQPPATTTPSDPPAAEDQGPPPEIQYDFGKLPPDVARMRGLLIEACKTGDIEKLRPMLGTGDDTTQISLSDVEGDPVAFLKSLSGDDQGQEILAIMEEVLEAGYVHLDAGSPEELYVWPYFFGVPLDKLTPPQKVELFRIVTAGDYEEMKTFGSYIFYRLGITPQGHWAFFVAGE